MSTQTDTKLLKALEAILREAKVANEVVRLGRSREGAGHTTVATILHRIEQVATKALKTTND